MNKQMSLQGHNLISYMAPDQVDRFLQNVRATDNATIDEWAGQNTSNHLVLRRHYQSVGEEEVGGFYDKMLENRSVLELDSSRSFTYRIPVTTQTGLRTTHDTSGGRSGNVGAGGDVFKIGLNQEFKEGEQISVDLESGPQLMVVGEAYNDGIGWIHDVVIADLKVESYPTEYLKAGVDYKEGGHNTGEFGTVFAGVRFPGKQGYAECSFNLASVTGVEHKVTDDADSVNISAIEKEHATGLLSKAEDWIRDNDLKEFIARFASKVIDTGDEEQFVPDATSANIGSVIEELVRHTLDQKLANRIVFQRAAVVETKHGQVRINDGIIPTLSRAERIFYGRTIMMSHLIKVSNALYKDAPRTKWQNRDITINAATQAYTKLLRTLSDYAGEVVNKYSDYLGTESTIKGLISGPIDQMELHSPQFSVFNVPQVGKIHLVEDKSLEIMAGQSRENRGYNTIGRDAGSFRAIASRTDGKAPRTVEIPQGANFGPGARENANMYIVKPANQPITISGYINGRMPFRENGVFKNIAASYKERSREYWAYGTVDVFLPVPEMFVILEREQGPF